MSYAYDKRFFDYIDVGSRRSARIAIAEALGALAPASVLDVGCGRGTWLAEWRDAGVADIAGVDGDYVARDTLLVPADAFTAADLTERLDLGRRFDLVQSLEVAEHLPPGAAETMVDNLCRHGDRVLFSAAVPGQCGENHLNERPIGYWRALFDARGYRAYDVLRPVVASRAEVEPWYRFNTLLYVNEAGAAGLPEAVRARAIPPGAEVPRYGHLGWRARTFLGQALPRPVTTGLARLRARLVVLARPGAEG